MTMDINAFINIIAETIKDDSMRSEIYNNLLDVASTSDIRSVELGIDSVFDNVYEEYTESYNDDDLEETEEEDFNYDYEEEE
jgi:hypothetical protein